MRFPSLYEAAWIFIVYAFLGWCVEVAFQAVCHGKFINRGFLNGAVCPIYGFGILFVTVLLSPLEQNLFLLFLGSVVLTSALEYLTGFVLEKLFDDKWWDYSHEVCNLQGYICLRFSLLWGLACVFVVRLIHPMIMEMIHKLPQRFALPLLIAFYAILLTDLVLTLVAALKMRRRLKLLNTLSEKLREASESIGKPIASGAISIRDRFEEKKAEAEQFHDRLEEKKLEIEQLREKLKAIAEEKSFTQKRLLNSYPRLRDGRYKQSLSRLQQFIASEKQRIEEKIEK